MGASEFITVAKGKTADDAFAVARERAHYDHGHRGYTGTIAEKPGFVEFQRPKGVRTATIQTMIDDFTWVENDKSLTRLEQKYPRWPFRRMWHIWDDKWGPAVCIEFKPTQYVFCGMAST